MTKLILCLPSLVFSLFVAGCHIENEHDIGPRDPDSTCGTYCLHLYGCSSIADSQVGSCLDECNAKLNLDVDATVSACQCVLDDQCRALGDYDCPGAPMPRGSGTGSGSGGSVGTGSGGSASSSGGASSWGGTSASAGGGMSSAGGSVAGGAGGAPVSCQGGYDCGESEDCVAGACRQRCTASCQCPTDLSCIEHYCRSATPPPMCSTDCECASGQHCISGACG